MPNEVIDPPVNAPAAPPAAPPATPSAAVTPPVAPAPGEPKEPPPVAADWEPSWRGKVSADPKDAKTLERFASPKALWDSYKALRQRVDSGDLKAPLPDKPTPEQITDYRKQHDIPDKPDGYDVKGLDLGDADKPIIDRLTKFAHERHWSPKVVREALEVRKALVEEIQGQSELQDAEAKQATEDSYRAEWGADYRRNHNLIQNYMNVTGADPDVVEDVNNALKLNPKMGRWLIAAALRDNPQATLVGGTNTDQASGIEARIKEIETMMRTDRKAYNDPKISGPDGEYQTLLAARARLK